MKKLIILLPLILTACNRKLQKKDIEIANCLCKQGGYESVLTAEPFNENGIRFICSKDVYFHVFIHTDTTYVKGCDDGGIK
jgi:hypothetical protein